MARQFKGGSYRMNNVSFGAMMVSEQVRKPLNIVSGLIRLQAKANTERSSALDEQGRKHVGRSLADNYKIRKGPLVTLIVGGKPSPRISNHVYNDSRHAARREFGAGGWQKGGGTRDLRRAGQVYGDLAGRAG